MTKQVSSDNRPLAERMRPTHFDELFGQEEIWSKNAPLRRLVESDSFYSLIFWGPPGTGKTSLASMIGQASGRDIITLSAVHATVKDIRQALDASQENILHGRPNILLFVDEIHRLSKNQQDVLLPGLESGLVRFIGATTENPSFSVNSAILSRALVFRFKPLTPEATVQLIQHAMASDALKTSSITEDAAKSLATAAQGDARRALNLLSAATAISKDVNADTIRELASTFAMRYDKTGDQHYDTISAFIKSIRGSHPDAAIYYLARMIESGEDPLFIARRLLISASEDVGNANPMAIMIADSTFRAVEVLGMPEARIALAQCTTYLASSPKSNRAYNAINEALSEVQNSGPLEIPLQLRNAPTKLMKAAGYSKGYAYAHDDLEGARKMPYLPRELRGRRFYEPIPIGAEKQLIENLKHLRPTED